MIFVVIPIFNEEQNISNLHTEISNFSFPSKDVTFVFSDDGSSDDTINLINKYFHNEKYVTLGDGINRGPGHAFNVAFEWIIANAAPSDVVVTIEADCTSDLGILNSMLTINQLGYDLVLASVYAQGGGFDKTTFSRKLISSIANLLYRFLFDIKVQTISSFYRVYSVNLLLKIRSKYPVIVEQKGFICMLEVLIKSIRCDAKIIEVPMVLHSSKRIGASKMKVLKTTLNYFKFLITKKL